MFFRQYKRSLTILETWLVVIRYACVFALLLSCCGLAGGHLFYLAPVFLLMIATLSFIESTYLPYRLSGDIHADTGNDISKFARQQTRRPRDFLLFIVLAPTVVILTIEILTYATHPSHTSWPDALRKSPAFHALTHYPAVWVLLVTYLLVICITAFLIRRLTKAIRRRLLMNIYQRRLCMNCGYDLRGCPAVVCPECGYDIKDALLAAGVSPAEMEELQLQRSCLHCGYDLRATTGSACPECGKNLPSRPLPTDLDIDRTHLQT